MAQPPAKRRRLDQQQSADAGGMASGGHGGGRRARKGQRGKQLVRINRDLHHFRRRTFKATIQATAALPTVGAYAFTLDDMTNYGEFQALFDQYMIESVEVTFMPRATVQSVAEEAVGGVGVPRLHWVRDHDDANVPSTTLNTFLENARVKTELLDKPRKIRITPSTLVETYKGVASTSYSPAFRKWIDAADANVPHYGLKWYLETPGWATNQNVCDVYYDIEFACKGVR